jgi:DNA repair ATPase RecN
VPQESIETRLARIEERVNATATIIESFGPTARQSMEHEYELGELTKRLEKITEACQEIKAAIDKGTNRRAMLVALVPVLVALVTTAGFLLHG